MNSASPPDYLAIGHMSVDMTPDGPMLGGTVLYGALAAARFGARAAILTRGNLDALNADLRRQLDEIAGQVEIVVQSSHHNTSFTNLEHAGRRMQELHSWAGEIDLSGAPPAWRSAEVIHLAPIAQEIDIRTTGRLSAGLLGCTPQGWMRRWDTRRFGAVQATPLRLPTDVLSRIDAMVVSSEEYANARDAVESVGRRALAVVTRGQQGAMLIDRGSSSDLSPFATKIVDSTGAGDVFAAVLFLMRSRRESTPRSARYAAAAAGLSVQGHGLGSIPAIEDVEELLGVQASDYPG
ncbi:MAG: carbohydrate kinase [Chloroflexia bacterium]|nr:carbohydrate kinase [Chloroflexia bacterium]